jgi:hypothetical protein
MMLWNPFYRKFIAVEAIGFSPELEPDYLKDRSTNAWLEKVVRDTSSLSDSASYWLDTSKTFSTLLTLKVITCGPT